VAGDEKGGPPPLPDGDVHQEHVPSKLKGANASTKGSKGPPGGAVSKCNWEVVITVHSQHKFWPRAGFETQLCSIAAGKLGPPAHKQNVKMTKKDSPNTTFKGAGKKTFGATATAPQIAAEAEWMLTTGPKTTDKLPNQFRQVDVEDGHCGAKAQHIDLYLRHPLLVFGQLKFTDPEDRELTFPKDFPVDVYSGKAKADTKVATAKLDADGKFDFELDRQWEWFTFKFGNDKNFISNSDGKGTKTELKTWAEQGALESAGAKFFAPPKSWGLIESIWKFSKEPEYIDGKKAYKEAEGKIYVYDGKSNNWVRRIGEKGAPISLVLNPHWQFMRHEFFDRYYGHTDHGHERVNTPPMTIEGYWGTGGKLDREGTSHWTLSPDSAKDSVHCLPWIRQKGEDGKKAEKPNKDAVVQFTTKPNTFVVSKGANSRNIEVIPAADARLNANVDRLKLYDLPAEWKSKGYWSRYLKGPNSYDAKFWQDWDQAGLLKSRAKKTPMIFSLDDIVLSDAVGTPIKLAKTDKFAIFYHRFAKEYNEKGNLSEEGVYMPDPNEPYFSKIERKGTEFNYISDYPNWVRMVAGLSSCFDAFDQRTSKSVFGARAAVRRYDAVTTATPAGTALGGFPADITSKYFVIGPEWGQQHAKTVNPFIGATTADQRIGRFDMVLLRCCDRLAGDKELFMNMQYFRLNYKFLAAAPPNASKGAKGSAHAGTPGTKFIRDGLQSLMKRWNGYDGAVNAHRAELIPQDAKAKLQGEVIYFLQPAAKAAGAHFRMDVYKGTANDRAFMNSNDGVGQVTDKDFQPDASFAANSFTLAHELGHGGSLPDEYGEWWERCNHNGPGVINNIPADPFVDEGRDFDLNASLYKGGATPYPMMTMAVEMRNRYFWHNAEYARKHTNSPLYSKHGAYTDYKVPGHPKFPNRTYAYWPIREKMKFASGSHGNVDIYLHALGKEHFTQKLMPNGPWDGVLSVLLKFDLTVPATVNVTDVRDVVRNAILTFNKSFSANGTTNTITDKGNKDLALAKVIFRLSPRFLISNVNPNQTDFLFGPPKGYASDYAGWQGWIGTHFQANVIDNKGAKKGAAVPSAFVNKAGGALKLGIDSSKGWKPALTADIQRLLPDMLGIALKGAVLTAADLTPLAATVIDKNAKVV
jgi:hypothetical protein